MIAKKIMIARVVLPFCINLMIVWVSLSDEDYILQFAPPFNRLELLQAHSCPEEITKHVEEL